MKALFYTLTRSAIIALVLQLIIVDKVCSQDVRQTNITWQATNVKNPATGSSKSNDSKFVTGPSEFRWTQKNTKTYQFTVDEVRGTWSDLRADGQLEFNLKLEGRPGTAFVSRSNGKYTIRLRYQRPSGGTELSLEFKIDEVEAR